MSIHPATVCRARGRLRVLALLSLICALLFADVQAAWAGGAAPEVTKVSVAHGWAYGGARVTLTGARFSHVSSVWFGGVRGTHLQVASSSRLVVTAPAHAAGVVDVRIIASAGNSPVRAADRYRYVAPTCAALPYQTQGVHLWTSFDNESSSLAVNTARLICSASDWATIDLKSFFVLAPAGPAMTRIASSLSLMHTYHHVHVNIFVSRNAYSAVQWTAFLHAYRFATIYSCRTSCHSTRTGSITHDKWLLVSALRAVQGGGAAVLTTSTNFSEQQFSTVESGLLTVRQTTITGAFSARWKVYVGCAQRGACTTVGPTQWVNAGSERLYFAPSTGDPIAEELAGVDCRHGGSIEVMSLYLRRANVISQLTRLRHSGCTVRAIIEHEPTPAVVAALAPRGQYNHDKVVIIDVPGQHVVYAGSENLCNADIRVNDNVMIRETNALVFSGYLSFFNQNWSWHKTTPW